MNKIIKTNITNIGDPVILYDSGVYYMYSTVNDGYSQGFHCFTSEDCLNFTDVGIVLPLENTFGVDHFWAPEIIKVDGVYYFIYSARPKDSKILHVQIAKGASPLGPFKDMSETPLVNFPDRSTIDGHIFIDDDGTKYLYFSMDCSTNVVNGKHTSQIYGAILSDDFTHLVTEPVMLFGPEKPWEIRECYFDYCWNEGPNMLKHNGKYYLTYSANFYCSKYYCVGCRVSDKPLGEYKHMIDQPVLEYVEGEISGPGHNAFFIDKDGSLKVSFHIHHSYEKPSPDRQACYCGAHFENDILTIDYK